MRRRLVKELDGVRAFTVTRRVLFCRILRVPLQATVSVRTVSVLALVMQT